MTQDLLPRMRQRTKNKWSSDRGREGRIAQKDRSRDKGQWGTSLKTMQGMINCDAIMRLSAPSSTQRGATVVKLRLSALYWKERSERKGHTGPQAAMFLLFFLLFQFYFIHLRASFLNHHHIHSLPPRKEIFIRNGWVKDKMIQVFVLLRFRCNGI